MNFKDIEKFPHSGYNINVSWTYLKEKLDRYVEELNLEMNPDFQRGHVWNDIQRIKYVEYMLKCPNFGGKTILFNHPNWMGSYDGDFVLIDGLQRITTVLKFLNNEIPAYDTYYKDYTGRLSHECNFEFQIFKLKTKKEVIKYYIDLNSGGTPHSKEEIERVKNLI